MTRTEAAEVRTQDALKKIEAAQNLMNAACADLSAIVGAVPEWKRAGKIGDQCHGLWRKISYRDRSRWMIDEMHADTQSVSVAVPNA